jgi:hypothetical protein
MHSHCIVNLNMSVSKNPRLGFRTVDFENTLPLGHTDCVSRPVPEYTLNRIWLCGNSYCLAVSGSVMYENSKLCKIL